MIVFKGISGHTFYYKRKVKTEDQHKHTQNITFKNRRTERKQRRKRRRKSQKLYLIFSFIIYFFSSVHHLYSCRILANQIFLVHSTNCYLAFDLFITIFRKVHVKFILKLFYLVGNTILYSIS